MVAEMEQFGCYEAQTNSLLSKVTQVMVIKAVLLLIGSPGRFLDSGSYETCHFRIGRRGQRPDWPIAP